VGRPDLATSPCTTLFRPYRAAHVLRRRRGCSCSITAPEVRAAIDEAAADARQAPFPFGTVLGVQSHRVQRRARGVKVADGAGWHAAPCRLRDVVPNRG